MTLPLPAGRRREAARGRRLQVRKGPGHRGTGRFPPKWEHSPQTEPFFPLIVLSPHLPPKIRSGSPQNRPPPPPRLLRFPLNSFSSTHTGPDSSELGFSPSQNSARFLLNWDCPPEFAHFSPQLGQTPPKSPNFPPRTAPDPPLPAHCSDFPLKLASFPPQTGTVPQ